MKRSPVGFSSKSLHPFVKWAGGKGQLLPELSAYTPEKFQTYFEPFLGGGAFFFQLVKLKPGFKAVLSDTNADLIDAYQIVKGNVEKLIPLLLDHKIRYTRSPKKYYYEIRDSGPRNKIEKAARLIFLNKTCYNGLYRVNRRGKFNVPLGRYKNPNICDEENLRAVSHVLKLIDAQLLVADYKNATEKAVENDFVYFDPPYQPLSPTANFTSYTNHGFTVEDQGNLFSVFEKLDKRKCKVLLSNSDVSKIKKMYSSFKITRVQALRAINCTGNGRMGHTELLISNYAASGHAKLKT